MKVKKGKVFTAILMGIVMTTGGNMTEFNTEVLCYEFKGKINEVEFIEYINAQTGKEEDTLIVTNTENGTLTE